MKQSEELRVLSSELAYYTHEECEVAGHLYYIALADRVPGPYKRQIEVKAILDIADDGTLAGIEIIDGDVPPPSWKHPAEPEFTGAALNQLVVDIQAAVGSHRAGLTPLGRKVIELAQDAADADCAKTPPVKS